MIDISHKYNTLRWARAEGKLIASKEVIDRVKNNIVPKGDVYQVARAAGIHAAKNSPAHITFCHVMPIDWVEIYFEYFETYILISAEVKAVWKTGVEMEAMAAVNAALLNAYDMLKPLDVHIKFTDVQLSKKTGGKSSFKQKKQTLNAAIIVLSDSAAQGSRKDSSGAYIKSFLSEQGIVVKPIEILADEPEQLKTRLIHLADNEQVNIIFTCGGTGFSSRDITPDTTLEVLEKRAPGIVEAMRSYGLERTPFAMLSRQEAGLRGKTLIVNLPGSLNGSKEGLAAIFPAILHAFPVLNDEGHG